LIVIFCYFIFIYAIATSYVTMMFEYFI